MTAPTPAEGSGSGTFTRKLGPLPMWAWLAIGTGLLVIVYTWKKNQAASSGNNSTDSEAATQSESDNQIPQFVNQTYVQNYPPDSSGTTTPPPSTGTTSGSTTNGNGQYIGQSAGGGSGKLPGGQFGTEKVSGSDNTIAAIAKHFGIAQSTVAAWNPGLAQYGTGTIPAGTQYRIPQGKARSITVIRTGGQFSTIPRIAKHFGVTAQALIAANPQITSNGWDVHALPPGEVLNVPVKVGK